MPPLSRSGSSFARYKLKVGLVVLPVMLLLPMAWLALTMWLLVAMGPLTALLCLLLFPVLLLMLFNSMGMMGNQRLGRDLEEKLPQGRGGTFVGVNQPNNNTLGAQLMTMRLETDDNVGLLRMEPDTLHIYTEEGSMHLPASSIQKIELQRRALYFMLRCIRLEYLDEAGVPASVVLVGREARSLLQERDATEALYKRLNTWLADQASQPDALEAEFERLLQEQPQLSQLPQEVRQR